MQKWEYCYILKERGWKTRLKDKPYHDSDKWANHIIYPDGKSEKIDLDFTVFINRLGEQGWELVSVSPRSSYLGGESTFYGNKLAFVVSRTTNKSTDYAGFTDAEIWAFKRPKP